MTKPKQPGVGSLRFMPFFIQPLIEGKKTETRRPITSGNSTQKAGEWKDLRWDTANTAGWEDRPLIVRCPVNGHIRTVSVYPRHRLGDLIWVREGQAGPRATRRGSRLTLSILTTRPARLQQIQDHEVLAEGVQELGEPVPPLAPWESDSRIHTAHDWLVLQMPVRQRENYLSSMHYREMVARRTVSPRDAFAVLWDLINGAGAWDSNPLVWVYRFNPIEMNVDKYLKTQNP